MFNIVYVLQYSGHAVQQESIHSAILSLLKSNGARKIMKGLKPSDIRSDKLMDEGLIDAGCRGPELKKDTTAC